MTQSHKTTNKSRQALVISGSRSSFIWARRHIMMTLIVALLVSTLVFLAVRHFREESKFRKLDAGVTRVQNTITKDILSTNAPKRERYCERAHVKFEHADLYCTNSLMINIAAISVDEGKSVAKEVDRILENNGFERLQTSTDSLVERDDYWEQDVRYELASAHFECGVAYTYFGVNKKAFPSFGEFPGTLRFLVDCRSKAMRKYY